MTPAPEEKQQIPAGSNPFVTQAMQDLAQRQNISEDQITLLSFESMVWPDGAYGCPSPGMMYTQVLSDGYLIQLQVGKEIFNYHGGGGKGPFLCINGERVD